MNYYERIWGETIRRKAPETITPEMCLARRFRVACSMDKVDRRKVSKFINRHGGPAPSQIEENDCYVKLPECVDDILEFPTPRNTHYPIHWNRDLTMEFFSSHMSGYEGDWFAQKNYY